MAELTAEDSAGRLKAATTGEWMYVFKPQVFETALYVKVILRGRCILISFHEDEPNNDEEDA